MWHQTTHPKKHAVGLVRRASQRTKNGANKKNKKTQDKHKHGHKQNTHGCGAGSREPAGQAVETKAAKDEQMIAYWFMFLAFLRFDCFGPALARSARANDRLKQTIDRKTSKPTSDRYDVDLQAVASAQAMDLSYDSFMQSQPQPTAVVVDGGVVFLGPRLIDVPWPNGLCDRRWRELIVREVRWLREAAAVGRAIGSRPDECAVPVTELSARALANAALAQAWADSVAAARRLCLHVVSSVVSRWRPIPCRWQ